MHAGLRNTKKPPYKILTLNNSIRGALYSDIPSFPFANYYRLSDLV